MVTPYFMVLVTPLGVTISIKGWLHPIYDGFGLYTQRQLRRGFLNFLSSAGAILIGEFHLGAARGDDTASAVSRGPSRQTDGGGQTC